MRPLRGVAATAPRRRRDGSAASTRRLREASRDGAPQRSARAQVAQVPYPFTSRSEYERYMARPVGEEWNDASATRKLTRPAVSVRPGAAIEPIRRKRKKL